MANTQNTREAARAALETYMAQEGHGGSELDTEISDLIADLAHLADTLTEEECEKTSGLAVLNMAERHYIEEVDEGPERVWVHVIGDDTCESETVFVTPGTKYGICDLHDRRVKRMKR